MFWRLFRGFAPLLLLASSPAPSQPASTITAADLRGHVERLASDAFEGRAPGTEGERLTTAYIAEQLGAKGIEPAGPDGSWLQPLRLVERYPGRHQVRWTADGEELRFEPDEIALMGRDPLVRIADAPVIFAGHGVRMPERGIDQLAGADLRGAVALILLQGPGVPEFPSLAERTLSLVEAGAAAVVAIVGDDISWPQIVAGLGRGTTRLQSASVPPIAGVMRASVASRLIGAAGGDFRRLLDTQPGSSFRSVVVPMRVSMEVETRVNAFSTHNVVGRLRGTGGGRESLLFLGHWDHLGYCRPEGAPDRICNGAVDNASGIAMLIEVAGELARGPRAARDILFLATTAEETGLLGARHFAAHPVVPLGSIVAAFNMDTVAIHPAGEPVAIIGRGNPALDREIDATVAALGRQIDGDEEAAAFVERQDGWALAAAGVPAVMVGGSFSDMRRLNAFLEDRYHGPEDEAGPDVPLDGAADDANLHVALGRRLADPAVYRPETER